MNDIIDQKFENAEEALNLVLNEFENLGESCWVGYFNKTKDCLDKRDVECAVRARDSIPVPGMGGFGEYLDQYPILRNRYNNFSKTIGNLKVYYRYQINRKLVDLS